MINRFKLCSKANDSGIGALALMTGLFFIYNNRGTLLQMATKIIATICGLPLWTEEHIENCIKTGVSIFRLSSSFRTVEEDVRIIEAVNSVNKKLNSQVPILHDINQGVKKRILSSENRKVVRGDKIRMSTHGQNGADISIDWPEFLSYCKVGEDIFIGDGEVALKIGTVTREYIEFEVLNSGVIKSKKAITIPGVITGDSTLNNLNKADIVLSHKYSLAFIALSFVRTSEDIINFKQFLKDCYSGYTPKIIAKIETVDALENIDSIIRESDGIMIARGDLALQADFRMLGVYQDVLIERCKSAKKLCIVATQMLESIIDRYIPSRAEIIDISNAVYRGVDALMLGPETCNNPDGVRAIGEMKGIIDCVEKEIYKDR